VTKLSFVKAYAEQCSGSKVDAFKMPNTLQLDDDLLAGQEWLHRNGLPLLPWKSQGAPVDLKLSTAFGTSWLE
jgi:hypothetical protein